MRTILIWISLLKWVGLLGIPMLFSSWFVWKLFWLFWLFGILEILITFPTSMQALRQIVGIVVANVKNKPMPDKDNFVPEIKYSLPFNDIWTVVNGGVTEQFSHSWKINSQRYAYDFLILDEDGKSYSDDSTVLSSYYCYGKAILAPADGVVVEIKTICGDSKIMSGGRPDPLIKDIRGNYIVIRHAKDEYSVLAHLMPGSISVKVGQSVKRGEKMALSGNSGNTSEPHLHFQVQNGHSFFNSAGLPIHFISIESTSQPQYGKYDLRPIPTSKESFVARGQRVRNI